MSINVYKESKPPSKLKCAEFSRAFTNCWQRSFSNYIEWGYSQGYISIERTPEANVYKWEVDVPEEKILEFLILENDLLMMNAANALKHAIEVGYSKVYNHLLDKNMVIPIYAFDYAHMNGDYTLCEEIIDTRDVKQFYIDKRIEKFVMDGNIEMLKLLIKSSKDHILYQSSSALLTAVKCGHSEIVKLIVKRLREKKALFSPWYAIEAAIDGKRLKVAKFLIENSTESSDLERAFRIKLEKAGDPEVVEFLIRQKGAVERYLEEEESTVRKLMFHRKSLYFQAVEDMIKVKKIISSLGYIGSCVEEYVYH